MKFNQKMSGETDVLNSGVIVSVRGSIVDILFEEYLPPIHSLLHALEGKITIEVLSQLDAHRVRAIIALTPTQGLSRGMLVEDTGGPLLAPLAKVFFHACSMFLEIRLIARKHLKMFSGVQSITLHPPWQGVLPSLKFLKRALRSSMC